MTDAELKIAIATMIEIEGSYLVSDAREPTAYSVIISKGGKLYATEISHELAPDRFNPTARITSLAIAQRSQ